MDLDVMQKRQKVLADFGDFALQSEDLDEVLQEACRLVAEALGTGRAKVLEIEPGGQSLFVRAGVGWAPDVVGQVHIPMKENSSESYAIEAGEPVITQDIREEGRYDVPPFMKEAGVVALANVPIFLPGRRAYGLLQVDDTRPRTFDRNDTEFLRTYASLLGPVIDRLFKLRDLRSSEARYHRLFDAVDQGFCVIEVIFDEEEQPVDYRFLEVNAAFERQTGLRDATGRTMRSLEPRHEAHWFETYGRIARTGQPERFEAEAAQLGRYYEVYAFPVDAPEEHRVGLLFNDIQERQRTEAALRASEERHAFLLRLGDAMRAQPSANAVIEVASRLLGEHLGASRVLFAEFDHARGVADIFNGWSADGAEPFPTMMRLEDYGGPILDDLRAGRIVSVEDATDPSLARPDLAAIAEVGVKALLSIPLLVGGKLVVNLSVHQHAPRGWTDDEVALMQEVAERLWADLIRARAEDALRESESKYRALFESMDQGYAMGDVIFDEAGHAVDVSYLEANPAAARILGVNIAGRRMSEISDWELAWYEHWGRVARTGQPERREDFADAAGQWFDFYLFKPNPEDAGSARVAVLFEDVTERREAEEAVRESEQRFRTLAEGIPQLVWRAVNHGHWTWASPQWTDFTGQSDEDSRDWGWLEPIHPDDREGARAAWERSKATDAFEADYRVRDAAAGKYRWFQTRATPVRDDQGAIVEWLGTSTDVQDLREMQERQRALVAELQHRTRNLMGVVRGVTDKTLSSSASLQDFQGRIRDRLNALARVNGLLSRLDAGRRITFDELLRTELTAHGVVNPDDPASQVRLEGPEGIRLRSSQVQTLALGLHELATNALKYGALSRSGGRLHVSWELSDGQDGERRLRVDWRETGVAVPSVSPDGASAAEPTTPRRRGYGRELIERALPYQLKAETTYELTPGGLRCRIALPVSSTMDGAEWPAEEEPDA